MYVHTCVHMYLVTCVVHTTCFSNINKFNGQVTSLSVVYIPWYTYMWYIHVCTHEAHTTYYIHDFTFYMVHCVYDFICVYVRFLLPIYLFAMVRPNLCSTLCFFTFSVAQCGQ